MVNTGGIARGPLCYNSPVGVASLSQQKAAPYGASGFFFVTSVPPTSGYSTLLHLPHYPGRGDTMSQFLRKIWLNEEGQDIAGYPVMSLIASGDVLFNGRATAAHHVTWVW